MRDMCDICGEESVLIYPFDPTGELNVCKSCDRFYSPMAREIAFKIKNNISKNMAKFLEQECFHVKPDMVEWIKKHSQEVHMGQAVEN